MDAARLVAEADRAMRADPQPERVIAEAWQAYELTEAVGRLIGEERARTRGGGRESDHGAERGRREEREHVGVPALRGPGPAPAREVAATGAGPPRAARLTGVRDPAGTVRALTALLSQIGLALVDVTSAAEDETAYWECIEALDAVDEAKDRARALARVLRAEAGDGRGD
jgi:hypothetical protein